MEYPLAKFLWRTIDLFAQEKIGGIVFSLKTAF
jgi:hypothetical protein